MSKGQPEFAMQPTADMRPNTPPKYPGLQPPDQLKMLPTQQPGQPFPGPIQYQPVQNNLDFIWSNRNFDTYLRMATSFHVKQKVEVLEALVGFETENKYTVLDQAGNKIFYVGEESDLCSRLLFSKYRAFKLTVKDTTGQNMLMMDRELDCSCFCGLVWPDSLKVSIPSGQWLGSVHEDFSLLYPRFTIKDAVGNKIFKIEGPLCPFSCGPCAGSVVFRVLDSAGAQVGTITKEWSGLLRELFTDSDCFSISFPQDLDPSLKAVLLGALFLIDYQYFENVN